MNTITDKKSCRGITIANARGGVGKTFVSIHLAYMLAERRKKVLLIDTDPQGTVGLWLNMDSPATLYHLLLGESSLDDCVLRYKDKFDIIISKDYIKEAEIRMVGMVSRENLLRNRFEEFDVYNRYDFILIDTSPSLSLLNQNAYLASREVIIPVNMEPLAVVGASSIIESIKIMRKLMKHKIGLLGIVPTFVNNQSNVAKQVLNLIKANYDNVLPMIHTSVRVKEASGSFQTLNEYDPRNIIIEDMKMIVDRVLNEKKV
ncbi:MAG: ParA family protein [Deltaproteobacteria bacterium]|nr:ParA family protein [Deltaproteobacteria bacterium]